MILVDPRVGSRELASYIRNQGVLCEAVPLDFGDACFEGNGPDGLITIGVERKTISDMLNCIEDSRYSAHQRVGMAKAYDKSFLVIEGLWSVETVSGTLIREYPGGWGPLLNRTKRVMYSTLYRYLMSVSLTGVILGYTRGIEQTAINIVNIFHYFQKKWESHTSMLETQKMNIPSLNGKPTLVREWAARLPGIGVKGSMEAEKKFGTAIRLATADETEWLGIPGIGVRTAQQVVRAIHGIK